MRGSMSQEAYIQTVAQWMECEQEDQRTEEANAKLQEDAAFRAELESKFPMLRAWPGKDRK